MGFILLAGGSEFQGQMAIPDRIAIVLAGGYDSLISIIPAAAAPDNNHQRAGQNGVNWFEGLGATNVTALPIIDTRSANDNKNIEALTRTKLVYLLGGFPGYLAQTLKDSFSWQAIITACQKGSVIAGSSAGAMVLGEYFYDPKVSRIVSGLNLVKGICILPHHNTFGKRRAHSLKQKMPHIVLVGIDEETACISSMSERGWQVHGKGEVTLYSEDRLIIVNPGQEFELPLK